MSRRVEKKIIKRGSPLSYSSIRLFPKGTRDDLAKLYSFIRVVDECVDASPPDVETFKYIVRRWQSIKKSKDFGRFKAVDNSIPERVLGNICYVVHRFECDPAWVDAFLKSMAMDLRGKSYTTIRDTMDYMDGSSEVIGLLAAKTMRLPNASLHFAKLQGRALQFIHLIRDINEDALKGRRYFPSSEIKKFGLEKLDEANALKKPEEYKKFIRFQIKRYRVWQTEADKGLEFIPRRLRVALRTTIDMYAWTAKRIDKDPFIVFDKKVKPKKSKVIRRAARRIIKS